eukprot:gb/GECH01013995.1/.p1 GENE.gb/GECH01013995.1/~~gb/GECH01013995.1/.p1  ORF type:complete len:394 (+),score=99.96 gb/GECH01013995.1/:1-1182(+)
MDSLNNQEELEETQVQDFEEDKDNVYENKSLLMEFIKQLRPGVELWRMAMPAFILENKSMLEKISEYCYPHSLVLDIAEQETEEDRFLTAVRFWLSALRTTPRKKGVAKPYNPIEGEKFTCKWVDRDDTESRFLAEQVSHHPPVSAFYMENQEKEIVVDGYINPKSTFYGNTAWTWMSGPLQLHVLSHQETYIFEMPPIVVRNIMLGQMGMGFGGKGRIRCSKTGYSATIKFSKDNSISGKIKLNKKTQYTLDGKFNDMIKIKAKAKGSSEDVLYDVSEIEHSYHYIRTIENQDENESRRVWQSVTDAMDEHQFEEAATRKSAVEEEQRTFRKDRDAGGDSFAPKYFERIDDGTVEGGQWMYKHSIAKSLFENPPADGTHDEGSEQADSDGDE